VVLISAQEQIYLQITAYLIPLDIQEGNVAYEEN